MLQYRMHSFTKRVEGIAARAMLILENREN